MQEVAEACHTGAATNIIYGLSLGYMSVLAPTVTMAVAVFLAQRLCGVYGFALRDVPVGLVYGSTRFNRAAGSTPCAPCGYIGEGSCKAGAYM